MSFGSGDWASENFPVLVNSNYALPVQDYRTIRAMLNTDIRLVLVIGNYVTAAPSKLAGHFYRDDNDKTTPDNGGTVLVDASGRRWKRIFNSTIYGAWFGITYDGITDDSAALQAAIAASQNVAELFLDAGVVKIVSAVNITAALTMRGVSSTNTIIMVPGVTQFGLLVATTAVMTFSKFQMQGSPIASAGALLNLDSGSGIAINQFSTLEDVRFQSGFTQFAAISASGWTCHNCKFFSPTAISITIEDRAHTDAGDMVIDDCTFSGTVGVGTAVSQLSAGGLRFVNNKVIAYANGYVLQLAAGVSTSDLFLGNNSMEAFTGSAIALGVGAGVVFGAVQIANNEISGASVCLNMLSNSGPWMNHMEITGNNFGVTVGGTGMALAGCNNATITGNTIVQSTPGTGTGISINTVNSRLKIANNNIVDFALAINDLCVATTIWIHDNPGYNPVGASALAPGASPWTLQIGHSPATLYVSSTVNIVGVTQNGNSILAAATGAGVNYFIPCMANDVIVITYGGVLTGRKMVH